MFPGNHMEQGGRKILKNALQPVLVRRLISDPASSEIGAQFGCGAAPLLWDVRLQHCSAMHLWIHSQALSAEDRPALLHQHARSRNRQCYWLL